jgi:hypothetical protein
LFVCFVSYVANRTSDKLTSVHDRIYCCRSGSAADTQQIAEYVRYYLEMHSVELGTLPLVSTAAHLFRKLCYENKNALQAGIICGGWDPINGGSVYSIAMGVNTIKNNTLLFFFFFFFFLFCLNRLQVLLLRSGLLLEARGLCLFTGSATATIAPE